MSKSAKELLSDPEFLKLTQEQQLDTLNRADPMFRSLSPAAKQKVLGNAKVSLVGRTAMASKPAASVSAEPSLLSKRGLKEAGYNLAERGLDVLPTAGGMAGGTLGGTVGTAALGPGIGTGVGAAAGAGVGGEAGKALEIGGKRLIFGDKIDPKQALIDVLAEGGSQVGYEATGQVGGKLIKAGGKLFPTAVEKEGMPLLRSEATGGRAASMFEHFMERSLPGAGPLQRFRTKQAAAIMQRANELVDKMSLSRLPQEEQGKAFQAAIEQERREIAGSITKVYNDLDKLTASTTTPVSRTVTIPGKGFGPAATRTVTSSTLTGGAIVEPKSLQRAAGMMLDEIRKQEKFLNPVEISPVIQHLEQISKATDPMEFSTADSVRSTLLSQLRKYGDVLGNKKTAILSQLEKGVDEDIDRAIKKLPNSKEIENTLAQARGMVKEQHRIFDQSLIKKLVETGRPEDISSYIRSAGIEDVRTLRQLLPPEKMKDVGASVMRSIIDDVGKAPAPTPQGLSGMVMSAQKSVFRGDKFAELFDAMGEPKAKLIFGDAYPAIRAFRDTVERVHPSESSWVALHNALYIGALMNPAMIPLAVKEAIGSNILSRMMVNPRFVNGMTKAVAGIAHQSPRLIAAAIDQMQAVTRDERGAPAPWINRPVPKELQNANQ